MQHNHETRFKNISNKFQESVPNCPLFFPNSRGAFLLPENSRCTRLNFITTVQQIQKQGGMIITNLLFKGLNHKTQYNQTTAKETPHATNVQGETPKIKGVLAEQGKFSLSEIETPLFTKTLGGTTYTVYVHNSRTSRDSFEDKILRLLESEVV